MEKTMPLLSSLLPGCTGTKDTVVLHINHCMENSFYFTGILGSVFGQAVFVAVPYNDRGVPEGLPFLSYHGMYKEGSYRILKDNQESGEQAPDFLRAVRRMIELALEHEIQDALLRGQKLLIVEDGGYHYPVVHRWMEKHPELAGAVLGCVEQTTAGIRASRQGILSYPVVTVARSAYKVRVEAYFVADRIVGELKRMMRRQGRFIDFHDVLLIGYGIIGRSVAMCLRPQQVRIAVSDRDERIRQTALADGFSLWDGTFTDDMIVMGNVGKPSFTKEMLKQFTSGNARRIFLASTSSKQVEFEEIFPVLAQAQRTELYQADAYRFPDGKEIILLAQGFPLNFYDKSSDSLTYDMIDPVFSGMLLSAAVLRERREALESRVYLFGTDEEFGGTEKELQLLKQWMQMNHLHFDCEVFNRHPDEERLRKEAAGR